MPNHSVADHYFFQAYSFFPYLSGFYKPLIHFMAEFVWQKHYPQGVAKEIGPLTFKSLTEFFQDACTRYSDRVAFENMGKTLTFGQLDKLSTDFAAYLQKLGLKKGERIAI